MVMVVTATVSGQAQAATICDDLLFQITDLDLQVLDL